MSISRLHYLDFLRASMLFLGVAVHASHSDAGNGEFSLLREFSNLFRMACFFMLSGYFSTMIFERGNHLNFYKKRLVSALVPAIFCVIFLVPTTNDQMALYFERQGATEPFVTGWMAHAWFLFSLAIYTVFYVFIRWFLENSTVGLAKLLSSKLALVASIMLIVFICIVLKKPVSMVSSMFPNLKFIIMMIKSSVYYLPFFAIGIALYQNKNVMDLVINSTPVWLIGAIASTVALIFLVSVEPTNKLERVAFFDLIIPFARYTAAIFISFLFMSLAHKCIRNYNSVIRNLSEASYTVYILHYIIISNILLYLQSLNAGLYTKFALAFLGASILGVVIHHTLVKRFKVLSLILNGKQPAVIKPVVDKPADKA